MYCIVLYCIVLYCIVLYCIVLYCIVLYCIVLYCIVLYCIVLYCIVLYCIVLYCIVLYCIVLYCIVLYPQTDGQVERLDRTLKGILTTYVNQDHNDWDIHLPLALFAYRNSVHASSGVSPFRAVYAGAPESR